MTKIVNLSFLLIFPGSPCRFACIFDPQQSSVFTCLKLHNNAITRRERARVNHTRGWTATTVYVFIILTHTMSYTRVLFFNFFPSLLLPPTCMNYLSFFLTTPGVGTTSHGPKTLTVYICSRVIRTNYNMNITTQSSATHDTFDNAVCYYSGIKEIFFIIIALNCCLYF